MYQVDGRQFLLVPASGEAPPPVVLPPGGPRPLPVTGPVGYVAYALPER
jgi:hypothetical protein